MIGIAAALLLAACSNSPSGGPKHPDSEGLPEVAGAVWVSNIAYVDSDNANDDFAFDVATDVDGSALVVGSTGDDAYVWKFSSDGKGIWSDRFGTEEFDSAIAVTVDSDHAVIVVGDTQGRLDEPASGLHDIFVRKYTGDGDLLWGRQIGTVDFEIASDVSVDSSGNILIVGTTGTGSLNGTWPPGVLLIKLDRDGNNVWQREWDTYFNGSDDRGHAVIVDALDNVYITGYTEGNVGGLAQGDSDAFVIKVDPEGNEQGSWSHKYATSGYESGEALAVDSEGSVYVAGYVIGHLVDGTEGDGGIFLGKSDKNGDQEWVQQLDRIESESVESIALSSAGDVVLFGEARGDFGGNSEGGRNVLVLAYGAEGDLLWTRQFGPGISENVNLYSGALDSNGNAILVGSWYLPLGDGSATRDAFVWKIPLSSSP